MTVTESSRCPRCNAPRYLPLTWGGIMPPSEQHTCNCFTKKEPETTIPPSGLDYVRKKDFDSKIDSLAETCSALLKRIEALEKLTEEQTKTIISFTEHTNALMKRIEGLEQANIIDQLIEKGDL